MKIDTAEIARVIKEEVRRHATQLEVSQVGTVLEVGDGIARIYGLSKAMAGEMLEFEAPDSGHGNGDGAASAGGAGEKIIGQVFNLEQDVVGAVIFGDY